MKRGIPLTPATLLAAIAIPVLVGCAPPRESSTTTVTAASPPSPSPTALSQGEAAESPSEPAPPSPEPSAGASGETSASPPLCRATDPFGVTTELSLQWDGPVATGTLRSEAPSGAITVTRVRAERHGGSILADDAAAPNEDLVVHAATVREENGRRYIRLGDWKQPWSLCE